MTGEADPRNPMLPALEGLAAVETAGIGRGRASRRRGDGLRRHRVPARPRRPVGRRGGDRRRVVRRRARLDRDAAALGDRRGRPGARVRVGHASGVQRPSRDGRLPARGHRRAPSDALRLRAARERCRWTSSAFSRWATARPTTPPTRSAVCDSSRRRATQRLQALARRDEREAEQRLCSEALLGGRELFSLDPEVVLAEAAARAGELTGADDVMRAAAGRHGALPPKDSTTTSGRRWTRRSGRGRRPRPAPAS